MEGKRMKARVKATGEIGIVSQIDVLLKDDFISFSPNNVELMTNYVDKTDDNYVDKTDDYYVDKTDDYYVDKTDDYWERLKHQYAGMAMQGFISANRGFNVEEDMYNIPYYSELIATALVEKLKEEK